MFWWEITDALMQVLMKQMQWRKWQQRIELNCLLLVKMLVKLKLAVLVVAWNVGCRLSEDSVDLAVVFLNYSETVCHL